MSTATEDLVEIDEGHESTSVGPTEPTEQYEVVNGQFVEEPLLGAFERWVATNLYLAMHQFDLGRVLGTSYQETLFIFEESPRLRRSPDIAFVSRERWPIHLPAPQTAAWNVIPDLAVEVVSPTDLICDLMDKIDEYFRAGVRLVWVVHPIHERIYDYDSPTSVKILKRGDVLEGGSVLPGFQVEVAKLFGETTQDEPSPVGVSPS